jgi:hypothetical protein
LVSGLRFGFFRFSCFGFRFCIRGHHARLHCIREPCRAPHLPHPLPILLDQTLLLGGVIIGGIIIIAAQQLELGGDLGLADESL